MKPLSRIAAGFALAASMMASAALAQQTLEFGSMPIGSGWYVAAAAMEKAITPALDGYAIEIIPRGGGVANPMVVENGTADIAFSNVQTALLAWNGDEELYEGQQARNIRALVGGLNPVFIGALVRQDYLDRTGYKTLDDILSGDQPVRIIMKPRGSNIPPAVDAVLAAYGLDRDKIKANGGDIIQVDSSQIPGIIRDGKADLYFDTVVKNQPTITEVALTGNVKFLDLTSPALIALTEAGLQPKQFGQWFEGQDGPTMSANFGTELIANASLPDEVAYAITKAVVENMDTIKKEYPAYNAFVPEDAWKPENTGIPLHPGAERYYKEVGLWK